MIIGHFMLGMCIPTIYSLCRHRKRRHNRDHFVSQSLQIVVFGLRKFYLLLLFHLRYFENEDFVWQMGADAWKMEMMAWKVIYLHQIIFNNFHNIEFFIRQLLCNSKRYLANLEIALLATVTESLGSLFECHGRKKCRFRFLSFLLLDDNFLFNAKNGLVGNFPTVKW